VSEFADFNCSSALVEFRAYFVSVPIDKTSFVGQVPWTVPILMNMGLLMPKEVLLERLFNGV